MSHLRNLIKTLLGLLLLALMLSGVVWYKMFRVVAPSENLSPAEWFKHGALGDEARTGIPYWMWVTLPRLFPDLLPSPGGYTAFGLAWEPGSELPVGITKTTIGFPRVSHNCALCHSGTYRVNESASPILVLGAPAQRFNAQALLRFYTAAANDSRFNADNFLAAISQDTHLDSVDRLLYRFTIVPRTRQALIEQGRQLAWMSQSNRTAWGPGRLDAGNLRKFQFAHQPDDGTTGPCDASAIWNLKIRQGTNLLVNWGGESPALDTVLTDSPLATPATADPHFSANREQLGEFLHTLSAPKFPFPTDEISAAKGQPLYEQLCATCHEPGAARTSRIIPLDEIGTDPERHHVWPRTATEPVNEAAHKLGNDQPDLVPTLGYVAPPLDGLWLRAPYLHNGSVPTLRDLLEPVERRPRIFYRGGEVYDPVNVGFVTQGTTVERTGWKMDVSQRGNSNRGHTFGTGLNAADKQSLLEYLKTL